MNEHVTPGLPGFKTQSRLLPFPAATAQAGGHRFRSYWFIGGLSLLLLVAAVSATWWALTTRNTLQYATVPVTRGAITRTVTATGTVNPELTIIVGTYVSGVIQELYCDYNTEVKKGQVCAKIDPRLYQSAVDQGKANLAIAKAQREKDKASLDYVQRAFERAAQLVQTNAVSKDAFDNARSAYEQATAQIAFDEATIQQRQAMLDAAQVNLDYTDIVSPVDGTVVSRNVTMGQTVAASFQTPTLFLIASDLTRMQVDTNVSESDIGGVELGDNTSFTVDAFPRRIFQGTVSQIRQSPQTVQNVVTYDVVVGVDNTDLSLKPGMTAATRIVTDQRHDVVRVPNQALRYAPGGFLEAREPGEALIWVLRDGRPAPVAVVTGLDDEGFTEIVSGEVAPGDQVITAEQNTAGGRTALPRLRF